MSRKRVSFSPDITEFPKLSVKPDTATRSTTGKWTRVAGVCNIRLPKPGNHRFRPVRFLERAGARVRRAIRLILVRRRVSPKTASSRPSVSPQDSHRTEAIEECIKFINNSSCSFQRSNSVPINLCY